MWIGEKVTKKCKRRNCPTNAHELTFSCYQSRPFLRAQQTCQWLASAIEQARQTQNFAMWAYVFMPTHVHLLIYPRHKDYSISDILRRIKQPVSKKAIAWLKANHPDGLKDLETGQLSQKHRFWQKGGGYDRNITSIDTLYNSLRYIHLNPVRQKLVDSPGDWYYSSAAVWQKKSNGPLTIDRQEWPF